MIQMNTRNDIIFNNQNLHFAQSNEDECCIFMSREQVIIKRKHKWTTVSASGGLVETEKRGKSVSGGILSFS